MDMSGPLHIDSSVTGISADLNQLYEDVLRGFTSPVTPDSVYSPSESEFSSLHRASNGTPNHFPQFHPPPSPPSPPSQFPSANQSSSTTSRRRPLPRPPGATTATVPPLVIPTDRSLNAQAGPSNYIQYEPPRPDLDQKRLRQNNINISTELSNEDSAGPSNSQTQAEVEEIPTSPSTEFPDQYGGAYLPSYYPSAKDDPNASLSLGNDDPNASGSVSFASPAIDDYYTRPPPLEHFENPPSEGPSRLLRSASSNSGRSVYTSESSTFLSMDNYQLLRRPQSASSEFPRIDFNDYTRAEFEEFNQVTVNRARTEVTSDSYETNEDWVVTGDPGGLYRRNTNVIQEIANFEQRHLELHEEEAEEDYYDADERRFITLSLLSHLAVQLRDQVPRGTHVKGSIPYPRAFTGKDIVSTLHDIIQRGKSQQDEVPVLDRRPAFLIARSLQTMLFFYEVEWGATMLQDGVEDVYMFMDDQEGSADTPIEKTELPTGVVTILTKCYSASCDGPGCYSYGCPWNRLEQLPKVMETPSGSIEEWSKKVPSHILASLTENEINRQTIIHKLISKEEQYIQDLKILESVFIKPLRVANPPVMTPMVLDEFIQEVFGNILELLECNRRLLEVLNVRQREQYPVIQRVGDIFLDAATEFRIVYPIYVGHHPLAEKRLKKELEHNPEFRLFVEKCFRQLSGGSAPRLDLKHYLNRPAEHLQKYPVLLDAVYRETEESNPDGDFLIEAIEAIKNLQNVAQLRTFQSAMGRGSTSKWDWQDLVAPDTRARYTNDEIKRQCVIFELIKGEMSYVGDLENIENMYVRPLRNAEPPIIPPERLSQFIEDVFHNYQELYYHHRRLVDKLHEIQRDEHPKIRSITAAVFDAALNFREAYMEYIPNYPIAAYRIDEETTNNPAFEAFVKHTVRHPDAHRLDIKNFINRPIPRLLRYELLLRDILSETPNYHEDRSDIPTVIDIIKSLGKDTEPGVTSSKQKVELWRFNTNMVFKNGEHVDMDLLNEQRSLMHTGKLFRQLDNGPERDELFVILFDNYFVMTHPREKDGAMKYNVYRRPIPLDLLSLVNFTDIPIQRSNSTRTQRSTDTNASRTMLYPCTIHHNGRLGGPYILFAETSASRLEWKQKLEESLGLRKVVQESNKVFEIESLSSETFLLPLSINQTAILHDSVFTGRVTCSVPINMPGRGLVAIGCAEGVWIGYRHDSRSLRRVLHLKLVSQCAILEDFGLFLVLADKVLYAYHLEALIPTNPGGISASQIPQKIHPKDVQFFSIGVILGRTLVIYMKKKANNECFFYAVEPVIDKINEQPKASTNILGLKRKAEWFRQYKEFSFTDAYDLIFLRAKIAVLCAKGFMIMDLIEYSSVNIPHRDDNFPFLAKRCESSRPIGMFKSGEEEYLLCYSEFGVFVDKTGNPSRPACMIEWEGTAERVAMHSPYILLFDNRFIEVRHVESGRLMQIIHGSEIRCVWDGRSLDANGMGIPEGMEERMVQEPRIHAVWNMPEPIMYQGRQPRGVMQHVFELFPTIPLYQPGSLSAPSVAPYFPISCSPPRSPPFHPLHL